jgi:hypothetical protein
MRRGDNASKLKIGVAKGGDEGIRAHAWVERDGKVLIGGENSPVQYKKLSYLNRKIVKE